MARTGARRKARELALQVLYSMDLNPCTPDKAFEEVLGDRKVDAAAAAFARELVEGAAADRERIDRIIASASLKWGLKRMAVVDRNVLRMAVFELTARPEIPAKVVINEAIEISKSYGGEETGNFVNGVLDRIRSELKRDA